MPDLIVDVTETIVRVETVQAPQTVVVATGTPGPPGPPGQGGFSIHHPQTTPASTWNIPATGFDRIPAVSLYTTAGEQIDADVVASPAMVVVTFPTPFTGHAVLT